MNEKPILFSGEMVRAILESRKTQTRRVVKFVCGNTEANAFAQSGWLSVGKAKDGSYIFWDSVGPEKYTSDAYSTGRYTCPYGQVGDRLWVRETWKCEELEDGLDGVRFAADGSFREIENTIAASDAWWSGWCRQPAG